MLSILPLTFFQLSSYSVCVSVVGSVRLVHSEILYWCLGQRECVDESDHRTTHRHNDVLCGILHHAFIVTRGQPIKTLADEKNRQKNRSNGSNVENPTDLMGILKLPLS